jgi:L-lactate dehydrogenase complex protein LldG
MNISPAKENILKKIRQALSESTPLPFPQAEGNAPVFPASLQPLEFEFAEHFNSLLGKFIYCVNQEEAAAQLNTLLAQRQWNKVVCHEQGLRSMFQKNAFNKFCDSPLADCDAAVTSCEALIARTGSILMSTAQESGRTVSVYAPVHICIASSNQLVYDVKDGLQLLKDKYGNKLPSFITLATGPSRTADIEKTLVVGVHGPKEVYCFLVDEEI